MVKTSGNLMPSWRIEEYSMNKIILACAAISLSACHSYPAVVEPWSEERVMIDSPALSGDSYDLWEAGYVASRVCINAFGLTGVEFIEAARPRDDEYYGSRIVRLSFKCVDTRNAH